nr:DNA topoisomerase [Pseudomonas aeruginosa]
MRDVDLKALKTLPPKPYTQGELVKSMKGVAKPGVRSPPEAESSRIRLASAPKRRGANIIGGLIARGYLVKKGRAIRASDAAFTLIDAVPAAIADPGTTAVWEQALDMIEAGQLTLDVFIGKQAADFAVDCAVRQRLPVHQGSPRAGMPAVRRTHAPAQRQERPVLVVQPLPGLQRHAASRIRQLQARRLAPAP